MTRVEASNIARAAGLDNPRIIPHKGKDGKVVWNLFWGQSFEIKGHGKAPFRHCIELPVNVDKKRLEQAIGQINGQQDIG